MQQQMRWAFTCLALLLAATAAASSIDATQQRSLLQDALSNSNGCLGDISKCEPGACATRNIKGTAAWVCLRCRGTYEPVVDDSGQDNIIQCVCPKGFFEPDPAATSCSRCAQNSFCPGGDKVQNPTSRGSSVLCGPNMVTRNSGARSQADCVAKAGYAQTSPGVGTACGRSEYAPPYNRLAKCLRCQSGLEEARNSNLTDGQRISKRAVCMLPPGKFMSQGLVRLCPQGYYREDYVQFDAANGTVCLPCRPGITTAGPGAGAASLCNVVVDGHGIAAINNVTGPQNIPALPTDLSNGGLPEAPVCDFGYYSFDGYCAQCPSATVTRSRGAKSIEECMVPPGYYIEGGAMLECDNGDFREGWALWSEVRAERCQMCGDNIRSEPRDLNENPKAANGSLVRGTPSSCYIDAGQGMKAQGYALFSGQDCPEDTYGAAGKVYGWAAAPCKPCPRNMITDGLMMLANASLCINPDGFGYASEGASRCAPGFYAAKGSLKPCQACPAGRYTLDDALLQVTVADCLVNPGHGVINSSATGLDMYSLDISGMTPEQQAGLLVMECPTGYWSAGGDVGSVCQKCPCGSSTQTTATTSEAGCNVCQAGFGKLSPLATMCTPCAYGQYQPGGLEYCQSCPSSSFYAPVDGDGTTVTTNGTTLFDGAYGAEACVPWQSQLSPEAGQAYFAPDNKPMLNMLNVTTRPNIGQCFGSCPSNRCCLMQYDVANKTCRVGTLMPVAFNTNITAGMQLLYKLPPSALSSASSVSNALAVPAEGALTAKTIASGYYATCTIPTATAATWQTIGTNLGPDARTFALGTPAWDNTSGSRNECQRKCDNSNVCWGIIYDAATRACLYRGGVDALDTRSFFVMPATGLQANVSKECAPTSQPGQPMGGALPALTCPSPCGPGFECAAGQCECIGAAQGMMKCGDTCKNTTCDPDNCGYCGNKCKTTQKCLNSICAEEAVACGKARTFSGDQGNFTYSITIGTGGPMFNFNYDAYQLPDRFNVFLPNGTLIFSRLSGTPGNPSPRCICGSCMGQQTFENSNIDLPRPRGVSSVRVVVNGYCKGTQWQFKVGCAK